MSVTTRLSDEHKLEFRFHPTSNVVLEMDKDGEMELYENGKMVECFHLSQLEEIVRIANSRNLKVEAD
jgi:hypothetical protein